MTDIKKTLQLSRKIPAAMKEQIAKYLTSSSRYNNGLVYGLRRPDGLSAISSKVSGCSFGADKNGFFVYTHRARCKSYKNPLSTPKKDIDFIESTG
jgi:hypothetical protein